MPYQRFPKCKIISNESHTCVFELFETDTSVANTLRRLMIADVPTLAIDLVEVHENTTCLLDEYLAHRLGMFPIRWMNSEGKYGDASEQFKEPRDCTCEGRCEKCSIELNLQVEFDESDGMSSTRNITSADLVVDPQHPNVSVASFLDQEEMEASQDKGISLVKITHGQQLVIKAHARLGISKEHAKWCPVAVATYRFIPEVTLNQEMLAKLSTEQKQQLVDVCPDRILRIDEVTGQLELDENYEDMATFTEDLHYAQLAMKSRPEDEDFVTVKQSESRFVFTVESTGAMNADEIVKSALKQLRQKLFNLTKEIQALEES
mmetsp:Transcript_2455/g.4577  ORF Transcript_2455/g.4577 Transcript_2455/m.4577 type:complete len:320 (+) Transcript_2455:149-1108(+)